MYTKQKPFSMDLNLRATIFLEYPYFLTVAVHIYIGNIFYHTKTYIQQVNLISGTIFFNSISDTKDRTVLVTVAADRPFIILKIFKKITPKIFDMKQTNWPTKNDNIVYYVAPDDHNFWKLLFKKIDRRDPCPPPLVTVTLTFDLVTSF